MNDRRRVIELDQLRMTDLAQVGGKNASLGEMIGQLAAQGLRVPGGFATTAFAFREFIDAAGLAPRIECALAALDVDDVGALSRTGAELRRWIERAALPDALVADIAASVCTTERGQPRHHGRGALFRNRRGPTRSLVRWATGNIPQYQWLGQCSQRHKEGIRVAL